MKRILLSLLLLWPLLAHGASGDITAVSIDQGGWTAKITVEGVTNMGTYAFGLATNNTITATNKATFRLLSQGFDDTGTLTTLARTLYGTKQVRGVYPGEATNQETVSGGNVTITIALSEFVFQQDSNITCTLLSGLYGTNGVSSAATNVMAVVNNSTNIYPKPVANWSRPAFDLWTNTTARVACVAFGLGAQQGRSVRVVKFWATDEAATSTPTNTVTRATIDWSYGDATPVVEYISDLDLSGLANSNTVTLHHEVFPWLGSNSLSTIDGRYAFPSFESTSSRAFYCTNFPRKIACVSNAGVDATGVVVAESSFNPASPPANFLTIGKAARAIADTNFALYGAGRHDNAGGIIYLTNGNYVISGFNQTGPFTTNIPPTYLTVEPFPGVDRSAVGITNILSSQAFSSKPKLVNITIARIGAPTTFYDANSIWFDRCNFTTNTTDTRLLEALTNVYVTRCIVSRANANVGFVLASSSAICNFRLIRGNWFTNQINEFFIHPCTVIGNARLSGTNTYANILWPTLANRAPAPYPIIAYNRFLANNSPSVNLIQLAENNTPGYSITNGGAVVQNVVEQAAGVTSAARVISIAASDGSASDTNPAPNMYFWYNTAIGQRCNFLENAGSPVLDAIRRYASMLNNYGDNINSKDDLDYTDGTRSGNWPVMFGVGSFGNIRVQPTTMDGSWDWSFFGISSHNHEPSWTGTGPTAGWATHAAFINRASGTCDNVLAAGNGNYRVASISPLLQLQTAWVLPYDIEGNARGEMDPPGAYSSAIPRKGAGFF